MSDRVIIGGILVWLAACFTVAYFVSGILAMALYAGVLFWVGTRE